MRYKMESIYIQISMKGKGSLALEEKKTFYTPSSDMHDCFHECSWA